MSSFGTIAWSATRLQRPDSAFSEAVMPVSSGEPYTGLMALQLSLGGMNFLLFVATGVRRPRGPGRPGLRPPHRSRLDLAQVTVIIIMSVILWDLGQVCRKLRFLGCPTVLASPQAVRVTNDFTATHPRARPWFDGLPEVHPFRRMR